MKKLSAWILAVVMSVTFAVGCGGQKPIRKDALTETESAALTGMTDDELKQIIKISGYAITIPR